MDKTGTLTLGRPELSSVTWNDGFGESELLGLSASVEVASEHPLGTAIVKGAETRRVTLDGVENFTSLTGRGVKGRVSGRDVAIGNATLMREIGVDATELLQRAETLRHDGQTVVFVAVDGRPAGLIGVADPIKVSTPEAIRALHAEGLRIVMLTGDSSSTAAAVARKLGIDDVRAEVLPAQKVGVIKELQQAGRLVAMAGDGIKTRRRSPRLKWASRWAPHDVAIESAHGTLIKGDLRGISAHAGFRQTMRNIRQNLFSRSSITPPRRCGWRAVSVVRSAAEPRHRRGGNELELRLGDCKHAAAAARVDVLVFQNFLVARTELWSASVGGPKTGPALEII